MNGEAKPPPQPAASASLSAPPLNGLAAPPPKPVKKRVQQLERKSAKAIARPERLLPEDYKPTEFDVIVGRGKGCYTHPGNVRFRGVVKSFREQYGKAFDNKSHKSLTVTQVVDKIREKGDFIRKDIETERWCQVDDLTVREKVGGTFRDLFHKQYRSSNRSKQEIRKRRLEEQEEQQQTGSKQPHSPDTVMASSESGSQRKEMPWQLPKTTSARGGADGAPKDGLGAASAVALDGTERLKPPPVGSRLEPRDCDVIIGGPEYAKHPGNVRFHDFIKNLLPVYHHRGGAATSGPAGPQDEQQEKLFDHVLRRVEATGGRFIQKDLQGCWFELTPLMAKSKTSQAFDSHYQVAAAQLLGATAPPTTHLARPTAAAHHAAAAAAAAAVGTDAGPAVTAARLVEQALSASERTGVARRSTAGLALASARTDGGENKISATTGGVNPKDDAEDVMSRHHHRLSLEIKAHKGDTEAQYQLGLYYCEQHAQQQQKMQVVVVGQPEVGPRGAVSSVQAAEWFSLAARNGHANAKFELAQCYHDGFGVDKDLPKAVEWYCRAAAQFYHTLNRHLLPPLDGEKSKVDESKTKKDESKNNNSAGSTTGESSSSSTSSSTSECTMLDLGDYLRDLPNVMKLTAPPTISAAGLTTAPSLTAAAANP